MEAKIVELFERNMIMLTQNIALKIIYSFKGKIIVVNYVKNRFLIVFEAFMFPCFYTFFYRY